MEGIGHRKVGEHPTIIFIYDYQDEKITNIHGSENRIKVALSDIPQHVQDAFIATEDIRFYKHPGFDIKRLASSLWHNIKARAYVQGRHNNSTGGSQRLPVTKK